MATMRVGLGYDIHPLGKGRKLILGGIDIPHTQGLVGHSDADALVHAVSSISQMAWTLRAQLIELDINPLFVRVRGDKRAIVSGVGGTGFGDIALVPAASGLVPVDATGRSLPVDPATADVDLPVLASRDTAALAVLGDLRELAPGLFARVGEIRRLPRGDLLVRLNENGAFAIMAGSDVTARRLTDVIPVEQDLMNRNQRATELDLRYRDQVIARLP